MVQTLQSSDKRASGRLIIK